MATTAAAYNDYALTHKSNDKTDLSQGIVYSYTVLLRR